MKLDEHQTKEILALIAAGASFGTAARSIHITPEQLRSAILADQELTEKVRKAEQQAEIFFITKIREATNKPGGWRAAAWWLERRHPIKYGYSKNDNFYNVETITKLIQHILEIVTPNLVPEQRENTLNQVENIIDNL